MTIDALRSRLSAVAQAHALWKAQLSPALTLGEGAMRPGDAARDDRCRCGHWLGEMRSERDSPRWERARLLHARFHVEAGRVLEQALAGRLEEARRLAAAGEAYAATSDQFLAELRAWAEEGPLDRVRRHPRVATASPGRLSAPGPR